MREPKMTILVVSCDGYCDMWTHFFHLKNINWPDCPYETVLANNTLPFTIANLKVINCGNDASWSTRTRIALEQIDTEYVCFLLEDYFISERVDTSEISKVLNLMDRENIDYYKLMSFSKILTPYFSRANRIREIPANLRYGISLQPSIWRTSFFLKLVGSEDYNPWKFEIERIMEADASSSNGIVGLYDERNLLNICHMAVQGKYLPSAIRELRQKGYEVDILERKIMNTHEALIYNLKRNSNLIIKIFPFLRKLGALLGIESIAEREIKLLKHSKKSKIDS